MTRNAAIRLTNLPRTALVRIATDQRGDVRRWREDQGEDGTRLVRVFVKEDDDDE